MPKACSQPSQSNVGTINSVRTLIAIALALSGIDAAASDFHPKDIAPDIATYKIALDLFNGKRFCVAKEATSLLPEKPERFVRRAPLPYVASSLSRLFPCDSQHFEVTPFTPVEILHRLSALFGEAVSAQILESTEFRTAYNLATLTAISQNGFLCLNNSANAEKNASLMGRELAKLGYLGDVPTTKLVDLFNQYDSCKNEK